MSEAFSNLPSSGVREVTDDNVRPTFAFRCKVLIAIAIGLYPSITFARHWTLLTGYGLPNNAGVRYAPFLWIALPLCVALWIFTPTNRGIARALERIRTPTPLARRVATILIAVFSAIAFHGIAVAQGRVLVPTWQDTNMHMVQAQLIAHGRLWAAPHPLADQMETFFVFVKPVYAAIHFPGTSLLYAPFLLIGVGPAAFSCLMSGAIVGLSYRVISEIVDGVGGALVVPLLIGLGKLRMLSVMLISHHVLLVPALLAVWAYLHWSRRPGGELRWAAAVGAFIGFAGITRPVEAIAYAIAIGVAMAVGLRGRPLRRWALTGVVVAIAAAPSIALQLAFDRHVTGRWLESPYAAYVAAFHPNSVYGGTDGASPSAIPTNLPQKIDYYREFVESTVLLYDERGPVYALLNDRLSFTAACLVPNPYVFVFACAGTLMLRSRSRGVIVGTAIAFVGLYVPSVFFLPHYPIAIAPFGALLAVLGARAIGRAFAGGARSAEVLSTSVLLALSLSGIPGVNLGMRDPDSSWAQTNIYANTRLPHEVSQPAVVLSRYRSWDQPYDETLDHPHDEPVYTIDALWPEQSPIARFQDLGPARNREIYAFFAARHEDRNVYVLDRRARQTIPIGTVDELLVHGEPPAYFATMATPPHATAATTQSTPPGGS